MAIASLERRWHHWVMVRLAIDVTAESLLVGLPERIISADVLEFRFGLCIGSLKAAVTKF